MGTNVLIPGKVIAVLAPSVTPCAGLDAPTNPLANHQCVMRQSTVRNQWTYCTFSYSSDESSCAATPLGSHAVSYKLNCLGSFVLYIIYT